MTHAIADDCLRNTEMPPAIDLRLSARALLTALAVLLACDLVLVGLHLVHVHSDLLPSTRWSIERDRGFGEMFQYLKLGSICFALGVLYVRTRMGAFLGWIAIFGFLLLDDSLRIHEQFGLSIGAAIPDVGALRGRDLGELIFALLALCLVASIVVFGFLRGSPRARGLSADLTVLLAALAACGVGVDFVHRLLAGTSLDTVAGVAEDAGEMLVISLTCFYVGQWLSVDASQREPDLRFRPGESVLKWIRRLQRTA